MSSDTIKLDHATASPNSRRVRIFLAEKALNVALVPVDLGQGEQHSEAYRAINPRRVVPTLVLTDGMAIGRCLAPARSGRPSWSCGNGAWSWKVSPLSWRASATARHD